MITLFLVLRILAGATDAPGAAGPEEDRVGEFIEYRSLPELGQIAVSDGVVRGRRPVAHLRSHGKELAARGIFPCVDRKQRRSYRRVEEMGGHKFETLVVIVPPEDKDGDFTRRLTVLVDGRKKLDCSLGNSPDGEIFVYGVTLFPEDGTIEVAAVDADGAELFPPAELERIDHAGVITDDTLQPDEGEDEEEMEKPLERA